MLSTAERYDWFRKQYARFADSYCLTLVGELTLDEAIQRIGGENPQAVPGPLVVHGLPAEVVAELPGDLGPVFERLETERVVAVTQLPGWVLLVEWGGDFLGREGAVRLSRGTTLVAHGNEQSGAHFLWMQDGAVQLAFDPAHAGLRTGEKADSLVQIMAEVGFVLEAGGHRAGPHDPAASLALADFLTGLRLGPSVLHEAVYVCVTPTE
ncbi:DUF6461 domain-containing protein [Actinoplanes derwentensis]|uniref:Uncharacterized protein n=1 Tax=Actinoplanes derwentensis TaxID=113562 RepID=A0A1H1SVM7_9ACTN|nr:DUF6461 domain-containing protein [Actinoplanes derwentensis]GID83199.1 hypothetical protein Ade03nite_21230 [Actinoplanes derwentensis]SDS51908.1 hypothetical protein SAMN04489716_0962 [Actinoplanes derwentensis]